MIVFDNNYFIKDLIDINYEKNKQNIIKLFKLCIQNKE